MQLVSALSMVAKLIEVNELNVNRRKTKRKVVANSCELEGSQVDVAASTSSSTKYEPWVA